MPYSLNDDGEFELKEIVFPDLPYNFKKQQPSNNFIYETWMDKRKRKIVPVCRVHENDMSKLGDTMFQFCICLFCFLLLVFIIGLYVLYLELSKFF